MQVDFFQLACDLIDPEVRVLAEIIDPSYVESNDTFPVLDPEFDQ